jgi:hypothetical protein
MITHLHQQWDWSTVSPVVRRKWWSPQYNWREKIGQDNLINYPGSFVRREDVSLRFWQSALSRSLTSVCSLTFSVLQVFMSQKYNQKRVTNEGLTIIYPDRDIVNAVCDGHDPIFFITTIREGEWRRTFIQDVCGVYVSSSVYPKVIRCGGVGNLKD